MKHILYTIMCLTAGLTVHAAFAKSVREVVTEKNIQPYSTPSDFGGSHIILNLNGQGIDSLEGLTEVPGIEKVTSLYLFLNNISDFPAELLSDPRLASLKKINLMHNPIANNPDAINRLKSILAKRNGGVLY